MENFSEKIIALLGPTNTGKTHVAIEKMLEFVNTISQINTDNVEPLVYVNEETKLLRKDEVKDSLSQADALKNAPEKDSDYFKVPKFIKK